MGMKYSEIVDYDKLDSFKEECINKFRKTLKNPNRLGISIVPESIGETAVAVDLGLGDFYVAFNVEGLGTKNLIAESMAKNKKGMRRNRINKEKLFSGIGQDEMAMSLNDLSSIGATPILFEPIVSIGENEYLTNKRKIKGFIGGFEKGAQVTRSAIPGGETPTLEKIIFQKTMDLAGGSLGIILPKKRLILGEDLKENLLIYGVSSSGIHSNGVSLARKIAEKQKEGYFQKLPSGRTLGEALLTPSNLYSPLIESLIDEEMDIKYIQPITGHGWAKLMRKKIQLTYVIDNLPNPQEEFRFMRAVGPVDDEEAYKTWNMGIGLVLIAPERNKARFWKNCRKHNYDCYVLGFTEKGKRSVVLTEKNITYIPR